MAYIGNAPPSFVTAVATDVFSANGTATSFTLSKAVTNTADIEVVVDNIQQNPFSGSYSVSGATLTFSSAPSASSNNIVVSYRQATVSLTAAAANSVSSSSLQSNLALSGSLSVSTNTVNFGTSFYSVANGNVGIGTSSPLTRLHINNDTNGAENFIRLHDGNATFGAAIGLGSVGDLVVSRYDGSAAVETLRVARASGNFSFNSGYGSVATAYGCRAWVNFNGTGTVAIRASGNVSSITDNGTGDYTVNFTTAMPDVNYSIVGSTGSGNAYGSYDFNNPGAGSRFAVGSCRINAYISQSAGLADVDTVCIAVFR